MQASPFAHFIRGGAKSQIVLQVGTSGLRLASKDSGHKEAAELGQRVVEHLGRLDRVVEERLRNLLGPHAPERFSPVDDLIASYVTELVSWAATPRTADEMAERVTWLGRRFVMEVTERRQRAAGVTHFVWRSRDDAKVRPGHAERDDRVFPWSATFEDGGPGAAFGCRCEAEPAILAGDVLLLSTDMAPDLAGRIRSARSDGLERAAVDAAVEGGEAAYGLLRLSYLGYRRLFGTITAAEEAERIAARDGIRRAWDALSSLSREDVRQLAEAASAYHAARHADLRLLDLEHRLGLVEERALLRAYEDVAHLDASIALPGAALVHALSRLGFGATRLSGRSALVAIGAARRRLDASVEIRRMEALRRVSDRFAEMAAEGHGPQRHEGAVTRAMLEDRVLRGIDPMTGRTTDGVSGRRHRQVRTATRIKTEAAYVGAEAVIRRSLQYRQAWDATLSDIPDRRPIFEVKVPLEDALGPSYRNLVEGVRRLGSQRRPTGTEAIDFEGGQAVAVFRLDPNGAPRLITLYPIGG